MGTVEAGPRTEIANDLGRKICRELGIPEVGTDDHAVWRSLKLTSDVLNCARSARTLT